MSDKNKDSDAPVVLATVPQEYLARIIAAELEDAGIRAEVAGGITGGFRAEAPGVVQVLVAANELPRALEILREAEQRRRNVDWSTVDYGDAET